MLKSSTISKINLLSPLATIYNLSKKRTYRERYEDDVEDAATGLGVVLIVWGIMGLIMLGTFIANLYYAYKLWDKLTTGFKVAWALCSFMFGGPIVGLIILFFATRGQ